MREILFRGNRVDDGERVFGSYVEQYGAKEIYIPNGVDRKHGFYHYHIIPETIGQYTGLTDKNGTKIFEGDIVKVTNDYGETNLCSCGIGYVCFYDGVWYIADEVNDGLYDVNKVYYVEIIGNIHDNPKLLESEVQGE